jgi:hypothetical protein
MYSLSISHKEDSSFLIRTGAVNAETDEIKRATADTENFMVLYVLYWNNESKMEVKRIKKGGELRSLVQIECFLFCC